MCLYGGAVVEMKRQSNECCNELLTQPELSTLLITAGCFYAEQKPSTVAGVFEERPEVKRE